MRVNHGVKYFKKKRKMWKGSPRARERKRKGGREREVLQGSSWLCLSALAHQMRSASALECVCESSLTTDPPNHYHRNLIQTIHSASFIVCACVLLSIILLPLSTFFLLFSPKNVPKPIFHILFPQSSPFFNHWLLNVFTQTYTHTLYKRRFTLIHRHSCWLHFNGNPWAVTRQ